MKLGIVLIASGCVLCLVAGILLSISSVFNEDEKNFKEQKRSD